MDKKSKIKNIFWKSNYLEQRNYNMNKNYNLLKCVILKLDLLKFMLFFFSLWTKIMYTIDEIVLRQSTTKDEVS